MKIMRMMYTTLIVKVVFHSINKVSRNRKTNVRIANSDIIVIFIAYTTFSYENSEKLDKHQYIYYLLYIYCRLYCYVFKPLDFMTDQNVKLF